MLRAHPRLLSLSEVLAMLRPGQLSADPLSGPEFWTLIGTPNPSFTRIFELGLDFDEILYRPGPPARFTRETGVPPILLTPLPHLTADHEALFDELAAWVPTLDTAPLGLQLRRLFAWLCRRFDRDVWIERSGLSLDWLDELLALFPDARFVHLYRDGRECAVSMSRHDGFRLVIIGKRAAAGQVDDLAAALRGPLPIEEFGALWSDLVVRGLRFLGRLAPDRVMLMRYETLVVGPGAELRRLAEFARVEPDPGWLVAASQLARHLEPRWPALPAAERERLVEACAPGMRLLYDTVGGPAARERA
jgi:putative sulfotransferase